MVRKKLALAEAAGGVGFGFTRFAANKPLQGSPAELWEPLENSKSNRMQWDALAAAIQPEFLSGTCASIYDGRSS